MKCVRYSFTLSFKFKENLAIGLIAHSVSTVVTTYPRFRKDYLGRGVIIPVQKGYCGVSAKHGGIQLECTSLHTMVFFSSLNVISHTVSQSRLLKWSKSSTIVNNLLMTIYFPLSFPNYGKLSVVDE